MANLRIIYENIANTATITASSTTLGFDISNVKSEYKSKAHRSTGTTVIYELSWPQKETIGGVVLPATNLSSTATIRVEVWDLPPSEVPGPDTRVKLYDSSTIYAAPGSLLEDWDWLFDLNINNLAPNHLFDVNNFLYGTVSKTAVWLTNQVYGLYVKITVIDTYNPKGYIDCSKIVVGSYWESTYFVKKDSLAITINDTSTTTRTNAGDLISDRGFIHDVLSFDFSLLDSASKDSLVKILRSVGLHKNICVSIFPENNSVREQDFLIYGKINLSNPISHVFNKFYAQSLSITGW